MRLIVGLGNYGQEYTFTRHNMGFLVVDRLSEKYDIAFDRDVAACRVAMKDDVILAKPMSYMNTSGGPVKRLLSRLSLPAEDLILVHDDMDMEFGRIKIKWDGGDGGHKGVRSVVEGLGTKDFLRMKVGVGRDPSQPPEIFLLSPFSSWEKERLADILDRAAEAVATILKYGKEKAMSLIN